MATSRKTTPSVPTWGKSTVRMQVRGSGMAPLKATKLHVEKPDGAIATAKEAEAAAVWPSVRLRLVLGENMAPRPPSSAEAVAARKKAIAIGLRLAGEIDATYIVQDVIGRNDVPVLAPAKLAKAEAARLLDRTLLVEQKMRNANPWVVFRTGGPLDVSYAASVVVGRDSLQLHLPPDAANATRLEALLDEIVDEIAEDVPFAWAGVGVGWGGWASAIALATSSGPKARPSIGGVSLLDLVQRKPKAGADWRLWLGGAWSDRPLAEDDRAKLLAPLTSTKAAGRTVERRGETLVCVSVTRPRPFNGAKDAKDAKDATKLMADLDAVVTKSRALARRAVLRRAR